MQSLRACVSPRRVSLASVWRAVCAVSATAGQRGRAHKRGHSSRPTGQQGRTHRHRTRQGRTGAAQGGRASRANGGSRAEVGAAVGNAPRAAGRQGNAPWANGRTARPHGQTSSRGARHAHAPAVALVVRSFSARCPLVLRSPGRGPRWTQEPPHAAPLTKAKREVLQTPPKLPAAAAAGRRTPRIQSRQYRGPSGHIETKISSSVVLLFDNLGHVM